MATIKRGRVLRDTSAGEGLVFVDGNQYPFKLEGMWRSEFAPKANMAVDVEFDEQGNILAVRSVAGSTVAGEQASQALDAAGAAAKKMAAEFQSKGLPVIQEWAKAVGYNKLIAFGVLVISWFFLPAVTIKMGFLGDGSITFYESLKFLNSGAMAMGGGGAGFYGFLVLIALVGVVAHQFWKDPRAAYGMCLPLLLMGLVFLIAYFKASSQMSDAQEAMGQFGNSPEYQEMARNMASEARKQMWAAFSFGFGLYLALGASLYLAWLGFKSARGGSPAPQLQTA
jgi:hypothetical protein